MSETGLYLVGVLVAVAVVSYILRALPFVLFGSGRKPSPTIKYIGDLLAPAVMAMLVVYCFAGYLKNGCLDSPMHGCAEFAAASLTVAVHLWHRNPLLSIACGTALYMLLLR